ncbi:asparagine synthase (glutamine-hydrolyzing) [Longimicrobium sp.]|uniref:asparagine synthase (glutamine-hydrolyzing) n=1 Tax=Longimicrobium sp. TaxID=2029185 RepID=UPI002E334D00|nr:asparagine synthase (glutamine-hydrolyzing) [Longimicrobium sp.]HEX6040438.1 asparagine synthase (glutamine-hydrolyzing) [Longimicrobium sp.]
MCGIVASVSRRGAVSADAVGRAARRLRHRGPDVQQAWVSPDRRAGLGHARLSIIDLRTGDQPIASEDGRLRLVANGELYDFERIRAELEARGHVFRTRSDSEIALHLYEDLGTRAVHRLRGEFALALWDGRDGQLFAARDRFGIKPLFYTVHEGAFHLASEVKALAELGVPLRWDREMLHDVQFVTHPPDRTLFAGVYQLPPGCCLLTDGEQVRVMPYWDWDFPPDGADGAGGDPAQWIQRVRDALREAVRLRLRADVPVGCYLSGGLDSCALLGVASELSGRPLRAYTLSFDHADYDEAPIAREQALRCGAEYNQVDVRAADLADHFAGAVRHAERPFANAHAVAKYLLSRAVRDSGTRVVLTGEGGDEIFAGYPHVRRDLVLHGGGDPAEKARLLAELEESNRVSSGTLLPQGSTELESVRRVLGFVPSQLEGWAQVGMALLELATDDFRAAFAGRDTYRVVLGCLDVERQMAGRHPVNQSLYLWGRTMLPSYILCNVGDRMEMAHSVEGRLPLLDHHLARVAACMPVEMKIRGMTEKYALREAARPVLTDTVYRRQKHPFKAPPATLRTDGPLFAFLQDTLRGATLDGPGIYDRGRVAALLDAVPSMDAGGRARTDMLLIWMAGLCILHESLGVSA